MIRPGVAWRATLVLVAASVATFANASGAVVAVGGALSPDNEAIYLAILERTASGGPVCVLPTASDAPGRSMRSYVRDFERWGGRRAAVGIRIDAGDVARAGLESTARRLRGCGGFFFTGGDQSRIVDTLRPGGAATPAYLALRERFRAGAVVSGSSAGAAALSDPMIGGGDADAALRGGVATDPSGGGVWIRNGIGFVRDALVDQHHLARGRFPRLLVAVADVATPAEGWGVDEDTALVIEPDGAAAVVGRSAVVLVRLDSSDGSGVRTGTLLLLAGGDRRERDGTVVPAGERIEPPPGAGPVTVPDLPWRGDAFHRFLRAWCATASDGAVLPAGDGTLALARGDGFRAWTDRPGEPAGASGCGPIALRWDTRARVR